MRRHLLVGVLAALAVVGCLDDSDYQKSSDRPSARTLPPSVAPAPTALTMPDSSTPPAEPPSSPGTSASMSPHPTQGHDPRPSTLSASTPPFPNPHPRDPGPATAPQAPPIIPTP